MNRQDFLEAVDWARVAAELAEYRAVLELRVAQIDAEVRAGVRRLNVKTQEQRARAQAPVQHPSGFGAFLPGLAGFGAGYEPGRERRAGGAGADEGECRRVPREGAEPSETVTEARRLAAHDRGVVLVRCARGPRCSVTVDPVDRDAAVAAQLPSEQAAAAWWHAAAVAKGLGLRHFEASGAVVVRSLFGALLGAATAVAGLLILAAPAVAADPPTLTGSARSAAHGPGTVGFTYTIDAAAGLDSAEFTTHQDSLLPADAGSVTFDGTAVARAQITVSGSDLTVPLGTVAAGTHTLRFTARVPAGPSTVTRSSADLSYAQAGVKQTSLQSAAVRVDINEPDIEVLSFLGEGPVPEQSVGTGTPAGWDFTVRNIGFGAPPTTLRFTVPDGLGMPTFDGPPCCTSTGKPLPPLQCKSTPEQLECALGSLAHGQAVDIGIGFTASASAIPGTTASLIITATPDQGVDQDPSNNTLTVPIRFTGLAHLTSRATTPTRKVTVGRSTVVTVTVHNNGPDPADVTIAFVNLDFFKDLGLGPNHFQFTSFDGDTGGDNPGFPIDPTGVEWVIGTLGPGKTATAHLTVRAISVGTGDITIDTESAAGELPCEQKDTRGKPFCGGLLTLTAIAETPTATPTPTQPAGSNQLAATGTTPWPLTWLGFALLTAGAILICQGRRRGERH